jgi:hypothetical protein
MRPLLSMLSSESEATVATRASLLERLKDWEDQASWQQFFDIYWKLIYDVARRSGLPEADARDIVQETLLTAAPPVARIQIRSGGRPIQKLAAHGHTIAHHRPSSPSAATCPQPRRTVGRYRVHPDLG